jgi:hypothetical protein
MLGLSRHTTTVKNDGWLSRRPALADRLEQARAAALADRERTARGPAVVALSESAG